MATQLGIGALASFGVSLFVKDSITPMVLIMTSTTLLALLVLLIGKRNIKKTIVNTSDDAMTMAH